MPRRRQYTDEQIINKLREVEVLLSQAMDMEDIFKQLEVSKQTYYRLPQFGGRYEAS